MTATADDIEVPLSIRLHLGRAAVQTIADRASIDILHIKGDAVHPRLRPVLRPGTDIDVLVRPAHVGRLHRELRAGGWQVYSTFENGSPFGHAQTYRHGTWGFVDVHRLFPGIGRDPAAAFELLWSERETMTFGGIACPVPKVSAQAAILVLNAARMRAAQPRDLGPAWRDATPADREELSAQIDALDARLAFDVAFGRLHDHRAASEYRLWKAVSEGGGRVEEWWGRVAAAPTLAARIRVIGRAPLVNVQHLEHELGRPPTRREVIREFFARPIRGLREIRRRASAARRRA